MQNISKRFLVVWLFLLGMLVVGASYLASGWLQDLLVNLGGGVLTITLGVVVVNIYFERAHRRAAIQSILRLTQEAMTEFRNTFHDLVLTKFGTDEFQTILESYLKSQADPKVIKPDDREKFYLLAKARRDDLIGLIDVLEESVSEMTSLAGWDLDASLLSASLEAKHSIRQFRSIDMDDSDEAKLKTVEHLIDIYGHTSEAQGILVELSGLKVK